jgi:predicted acetyltransferase
VSEIDVRPTAPEEYRAAADTMRLALMSGPASDEDWEKYRDSWDDQLSITAWDGDRCVGHVGAFRFDSVVPGGARVPTAGVTRIGILPTATRQGLLTRMLTRCLADARAEGIPLAALRASEAVIYGRFGFGVAGESTHLTVDPLRARPLRGAAPGSFRLLARAEILETLPGIYDRCAHRPGVMIRAGHFWKRFLEDALTGDKGSFVAVHTGLDGTDDGFVHYSTKWSDGTFTSQVGAGEVHDLWGATPAVELALWDYLVTNVDLVRSWEVEERPVDDVLRWAAHDRRCIQEKDRFDEQWIRLLDVERCLAARTYRPVGAVRIAVDDPMFEDNTDVYEVAASGVRRLGRGATADVTCDIDGISAAYYGAVPWQLLAATGRAAGEDEAIRRADDLFAHRPLAWCGSFF